MATTYYCNVGGRTLSQVSGGVRRDFLTDAIGSVTATVNEHGNIENTYRYKPYGGTLAKTGTGVDPRLGWREYWSTAEMWMSDTAHVFPGPAQARSFRQGWSGTFMAGMASAPFNICGEGAARWDRIKVWPVTVTLGNNTNARPCSEFQFETIFALPANVPKSRHGAVIQMVDMNVAFGYCKGASFCKCDPIKYMEAWTVQNGQFDVPSYSGTSSSPTTDDSFMFGCRDRKCIFSRVVLMSGKIGYVDDCKIVVGRGGGPGWQSGGNSNECTTPWNGGNRGNPIPGMAFYPSQLASKMPNSKQLDYQTDCCLEGDGFKFVAKINGHVSFVRSAPYGKKKKKECC